MDYDSMLKIVKAQNPKLSFKEQQKLASEKYKEFKNTAASFSAGKDPGDDPPADTTKATKDPASKAGPVTQVTKPEITISELVAMEKRMREKVIDVNSVQIHGRQVIPEGKLIKHGKQGVNTLVTWEDDEGNKLPLTGYFSIFI